MHKKSSYVLTIDPIAMERCFLVGEILADDYEQPYLEYGLIGLAAKSEPLHVVATPLLPGQHVTGASVHQAGRDVLRLRRESQRLSERLGVTLVPIAFVHRHPIGCDVMSSVDEEFLLGPLVDQVATVIVLSEKRLVRRGEFDCDCWKTKHPYKRGGNARTSRGTVRVEHGVAFSIIVSTFGDRMFSVHSAQKQWCPWCHRSVVRLVPAELHISPNRQLTAGERHKLRRALEIEIEAKLAFDPRPLGIAGESS